MASQYQMERDRGTKESDQQLALLREKWPLAFPIKDDDIRPLARGAAREIAAAMGWSIPYTLGVLGRWKVAAVYCRAVLGYDQRIALDGLAVELVGVEAKEMATKRLAQLAGPKSKPRRSPLRSSRPLPLGRLSNCVIAYARRSCGGAHSCGSEPKMRSLFTKG
jgi:hypothetical protein